MTPRWHDGHTALLLVVAVLLAWLPVLQGDFVYDDAHSVSANEAVHGLANVPRFFVDADCFSALNNRMYRPLLLVTFAWDHTVGGGEPWPFKLTNLLLHLAVVLALWRLARRWGAGVAAAAIPAVLFAVHPLASEAINMVSGRSELLLLAGILAALHGHTRARCGGGWPATALMVGGTILACGSKATGVVIPALLLFVEGLDVLRRRRPMGGWRPALGRVLPVAAVVLVYLVARHQVLGMATTELPALHGPGDIHSGASRPLAVHWATMAVALPRVLGQCLVPLGLSLDPPVPWTHSLDASVVTGLLLLGLLTWLGLRCPRRRPLMALGTVMAWAVCSPWIVVPLNVPLSEHRYYGLLAALALAVAGALPGAMPRRWPVVLTGALAGSFALLAGLRSADYDEEIRLWQSARRLNPESFRVHASLGSRHVARGNLRRARRCFLRALVLNPRHNTSRINLVDIELALGDEGDVHLARTHVRVLRRRDPLDPYYRIQEARVAIELGRRTGDHDAFVRAETLALSCLENSAPRALVFKVAALARELQGDPTGALLFLDASVAMGRDHVSVFLLRSEILSRMGDRRAARAAIRAAERRAPDEAAVQRAKMRHALARPPAPR